jgi:hypothetical protein
MGFRTPMSDVTKNVSTASSESDSNLSLSSASSTISIEASTHSGSSEHLRCPKRMLLYEDGTPPPPPPPEEKEINPSSTKSKEVYIPLQ